MRRHITAVAFAALSWGAGAFAAQQGSAPVQAPQTPRAAAPVDLTGVWVPLITEDWRFRMVTPPKGDVASVPVNEAGRKAAEAWDRQRTRCRRAVNIRRRRLLRSDAVRISGILTPR